MIAVLPTPSERLALSRERLRQAMRDISAPAGAAPNQRAGASVVAWFDGLKSLPGVNVVIAAVSSWWVQHPLRLVSMLVLDAAKIAVQPMAQRNPLGLVLGARGIRLSRYSDRLLLGRD